MKIFKILSRLLSFRMIAIGLTFVQTMYITRIFGTEIFGQLSFALSISAILTLALCLGLDQLLMREIAKYGLNTFQESNKNVVHKSLFYYCVLPITFLLTFILIVLVFFSYENINFRNTIIGVVACLPLLILRKYAESISQGTKKIFASIIGSQLVYPAVMIAGCFYIWFLGIEPNSTAILVIYILAVVLSVSLSIILASNSIKTIFSHNRNLSITKKEIITLSKDELKSGFHFALVSFSFILSQHVDVLLMGSLSSAENVALVRIASRVAELAGIMRAIILIQYKPILAQDFAQRKMVSLQKNTQLILSIFLITGVPITITVLTFSKEILDFFGTGFSDAAIALKMYICSVFISLAFGPTNSLLAMTGHESVASKNLKNMLIVQVTLLLILIPSFGVNGCAFANLVATSYLSIKGRFDAKRLLSIETSFLIFFRRGKF